MQARAFPKKSFLIPVHLSQSPVVLRTCKLTKAFGDFKAVDDLHLNVEEGKIYGFLGRNGAGKTTAIRMFMGIISPDAGSIEFFGKPTRHVSILQKQSIGYLSQGQYFYSWMTCRGIGNFVAGFYPTWDDAEFDRLLSVLDLPPKRKISALSQGMKVKLALALALAHQPPLLILDEPTSGLDPVARREFLEIVQQQARKHNRTTFFSSHLIDEVERIADRVGIIDKGRLCYEGDIATLQQWVRAVRWRPGAANRVHGTPLPEGFELLQEDKLIEEPTWILRASPDLWNQIAWEGANICQISLEDIFIALTRGTLKEL